ncbi:MAG TPA: DUF4349 domain-containing protein [Gemmataceae bacterium]|nr:DUF4349 domain-containing protein [Gemmataceae bacterium]
MSEHEWVQDNLDAYVADGLSADERTRTEQHVAGCADCTQALTQARKLETTMANLFADAHPDAKLEDRMIQGLRQAPKPARWSMWTRFAAGVAAAVLLGAIGVGVQAVAGTGLFGPGEATAAGYSTRSYFGWTKTAPFDGVDGINVEGLVDDSRSMGVADFDALKQLESKKSDAHAQQPPGGGGVGSGGQGGANEAGGTSKAREADFSRRATTYFYRNGVIPSGKNPAALFGYSTGGEIADPANLSKTNQFGLPVITDSPKSPALTAGLLSAGTLTPESAIANAKADTKKKAFDLDVYTKANLKPSDTYYRAPDEPAKTPPPPPSNGPPQPGDGEAKTPDGGVPPAKEEKKAGNILPDPTLGFNPIVPTVAKQEKTKPEPQVDSSLKIIRTGEMEFEVDSFDKAVQAVGALIKPLLPKGGRILTSNSEKQANGKTRGQVVVRMPPEHLDDFVLDLRRDLGKMGDLKMQHIGSQDVTKQFTDTESELKAARTVEKRLLSIIETGKGEVKDLIAAEKELGVWRTKIEKMEGELRYYANQVALSTLTIRLVEKEISAAAALVVSATVKTRIEVDNVTKARETAEKAVEELKGRIVKSDEKQLPAGQVEAILHAEIPPANKDAFRRVLEKLGIVSSHEDTQTQSTEGGTGPVLTPRRKVNDVLFQVTLNNIVNIRPKHSVKLDVVTADVRGNFEKLKDEINRVHQGQIREARLDENQDKQKAVAVIEFNVPIAKKAEVDKLIASFGPALDRVNLQADIKEISTEQKFGYTLKLYSIANVEPRERTVMHVEVKNVEKKTNEIIDIVKAAKGQVTRPKNGLNKQGQTEALLVISVPLSAGDVLVTEIKEKGKVVNWEQKPNPSVPENELATAQIVVQLTGPNPIIPTDEGFGTYVSRSLYVSFTVFATCLLWIVAGLSFVLPWIVLLLIVVWIYRRFSRGTQAVTVPPTPKA